MMSETETTAWLLLKLSTFPPQQQKASVNHTFPFSIPNTVILRQGILQNWFYTSSSGQILQNSKSSLDVHRIADSFKQMQQNQKLPAATFYFDKTQRKMNSSGSLRSATCIGQLEGKDLKQYLAAGVNVGLSANTATVMQAYTASHSNHNSVIRVTLNLDNTVQMVMFTNQIPLDDQSWPMVKKLATIEAEISNKNVKREVLVEHGNAYTQLWFSLKDIRYQIALRAGATILGGNFFFKLSNQQAHPVLLFATQLHMDRPVQGLPKPASQSVIQQMEFSVLKKNKPAAQSFQNAMMRPATTMNPQAYASAYQQVDHGAYSSEPAQQRRKIKLRPSSAYVKNGANLGDSTRQHNYFDSSAKKTTTHQPQFYGSGNSDFERATLPDLNSSSIGKHLRNTRQSNHNFTSTTEKCAFCHKAYTKMWRQNLDEPEIEGIVNPNQIKKLYEYFERDIASLLLVPANTHHQQQIFDGIYDQIKSIQVDEAYVPNLLQAALNIGSMEEYLKLKDDPKFLFREIRLCQPCYGSVKKMLTFQSDGIIRETQSMNQQQFPFQSFRNNQNLNSNHSNRSSYYSGKFAAAQSDYNAEQLIANLTQRQRELDQARIKHKLNDNPLSHRKQHSKSSKSSKRRAIRPTSSNPKNPNHNHAKTISDGSRALLKKKLDEAEKTYYYSYCSRHINCKQGHGGLPDQPKKVENTGTYVHYQRQLKTKKKKKRPKRPSSAKHPLLEMMYQFIPVQEDEQTDLEDIVMPQNDSDGQNQGSNTYYIPDKQWLEDTLGPQPKDNDQEDPDAVDNDDEGIMPPQDDENEPKTEPQVLTNDDGISEDIKPEDDRISEDIKPEENNDESIGDKSVIAQPASIDKDSSSIIQDNLADDKDNGDTIKEDQEGPPKIIINHIMPESRPFGVPVPPSDLASIETPALEDPVKNPVEDIKENETAPEVVVEQPSRAPSGLDNHFDSKYEKKRYAAKKVVKRDEHKDQKEIRKPRPEDEVILLLMPPNEVPNRPEATILQGLNLSENFDKLPEKPEVVPEVVPEVEPEVVPEVVTDVEPEVVEPQMPKVPSILMEPEVFEKLDGQTLIDTMINATIHRKMTEKLQKTNQKSQHSQRSQPGDDLKNNPGSTIESRKSSSSFKKVVQFEVDDHQYSTIQNSHSDKKNNTEEAIQPRSIKRKSTGGEALKQNFKIEDDIENNQARSIKRKATGGAALKQAFSIEDDIDEEIPDEIEDDSRRDDLSDAESKKEEKSEEQIAQANGTDEPNGDAEGPKENQMRQAIVNSMQIKVADLAYDMQCEKEDKEDEAQESAAIAQVKENLDQAQEEENLDQAQVKENLDHALEKENEEQENTKEIAQASQEEQPTVNQAQEIPIASMEPDHDDIHAVPDLGLLEFQRKRSTPVFMLSEFVDEGEEVVHAEIDNFAEEGNTASVAAHTGMARAGSEEQIIKQLVKAGSLDANSIIPNLPIIKEINEQSETSVSVIQQEDAEPAQEQETASAIPEIIASKDQLDKININDDDKEEVKVQDSNRPDDGVQDDVQDFQEEIVQEEIVAVDGKGDDQYLELSQKSAKSQQEVKDINLDYTRKEQKVADVSDALDQSVAEEWDSESNYGNQSNRQVDDQIVMVDQDKKLLNERKEQGESFEPTPLAGVLYGALNNRIKEKLQEKKLREEQPLAGVLYGALNNRIKEKIEEKKLREEQKQPDFQHSATVIEDTFSIDKEVDEQQKHPVADSTIESWVDADQMTSTVEVVEKENESPERKESDNIDNLRDMFQIATTVDYNKLETIKQSIEVNADSFNNVFSLKDTLSSHVKGYAQHVNALRDTAHVVQEMLDGIQDCINEAVDVALQDDTESDDAVIIKEEDPQQPPEQTPVMTSSIRIRKSMTVQGKRRITASYVKHKEQ